jgi:hypothetical protein
MFKVFIDGNDDWLRLENELGDVIGWIRGNGFALNGLPTEAAAIRAATESWAPLEETLQRGYPGRPLRPIKKSAVRIVHDGAYEWISDGLRPIARLLRPETPRNPGNSFALEFMVPSYATQHVTIAVAQAVWEVVSTYVALHTADMSPPARAERAFAAVS